eukprot:TRINITY_DN74515_c0_g1_i1.p1 TRINITY_DN74515_c0_g1~~TRINITY_DN74515_c0_g1_i1.p1  ORF type:complete len:801 (+),score=181.10 TRINITY_DN74515_c0_g1_i1:90-2492(+)
MLTASSASEAAPSLTFCGSASALTPQAALGPALRQIGTAWRGSTRRAAEDAGHVETLTAGSTKASVTSERDTSLSGKARAAVATLFFSAWLHVRKVAGRTRMGRPIRQALRKIRVLQLPGPARDELMSARKQLRKQSRSVPGPFRKAMSKAAGSLEDIPTFLFEISLLSAGICGMYGDSLEGPRKLSEALSLLYTAGRFHLLHEQGGSSTKLLGGDYLYAEGQWILAELGCLPVIKLAAKVIKDFSDCMAGEMNPDAAALDGDDALMSTYFRTGAFFATAAGGSAWLSGAPRDLVLELFQYGRDLGCALDIVRKYELKPTEENAKLLHVAMDLVAGAREIPAHLALDGRLKAACKGLRRLARAVEAETVLTTAAADAAERLPARDDEAIAKGLATLRKRTDEVLLSLHRPGTTVHVTNLDACTLGLDRTPSADDKLRDMIKQVLEAGHSERKREWPEKEKGGPKAALGAALMTVGGERQDVNVQLDGGSLSEFAMSDIVQTEAATMLRSGGKRLRPAMTLLTARAMSAPKEALQRVVKLATALEVLHSASLVHDDILDDADTRRGTPTLHVRRGDLPAVFVGDYLFAVSSTLIAELENVQTIALISKVIADFGRGELAQSAAKYNVSKYSLTDYLAKSFHKTASLLAAACQSAVVIGKDLDACDGKSEACYRYGMYVGLAFQVVDDILDFTETDETLGKPALADLKQGYVSAPVLLAMQSQKLTEEERTRMKTVLDRKVSEEGDLDYLLQKIDKAHGVMESAMLARKFVDFAVKELNTLPASEARSSLETFADFIVARSS